VCGQLHTWAAVTPGKEVAVPTGEEVRAWESITENINIPAKAIKS
jgi:hypothetical protein